MKTTMMQLPYILHLFLTATMIQCILFISLEENFSLTIVLLHTPMCFFINKYCYKTFKTSWFGIYIITIDLEKAIELLRTDNL